MKNPAHAPDSRAELDQLLQRTIEKINQDPNKAAMILSEWVGARLVPRPTRNSENNSAEHAHVKKKAA